MVKFRSLFFFSRFLPAVDIKRKAPTTSYPIIIIKSRDSTIGPTTPKFAKYKNGASILLPNDIAIAIAAKHPAKLNNLGIKGTFSLKA
jgi:expansin (peptidoglycan-binding protein)